MTEKQSKELLKRACDIITTLEMFIGYDNTDYRNSYLSKKVDNLFDEVDMLNEAEMYKDTDPDLVQLERVTPYENYVATVKRNIDQATAEGILRDTVAYNYLSKESFDHRCKTDLEFAAQWGDPNWLFPGAPLHDDPDMEAQDSGVFGENKI